MKRKLIFWMAALLAIRFGSVSAENIRAVSLLGSFSEAWALCGGKLAGVTEDTVTERGMALDEDVRIIGTTKNPSMELILDLEPELVIYSTEIEGQAAAAKRLERMGFSTLGFSVSTYEEYLDMVEKMCALTGRTDIAEEQVSAVRRPIEAYIAKAKESGKYQTRSCLLLRTYSGGVRAKNSDNQAGRMLADMGLVNIADGSGLMENVTLEAVLEADPDYIFVVVMGEDTRAAMEYLKDTLSGNPAWDTLSAVQNGHYVMLDKNLFHLKPNERWAEAYEYLYELLYE